MDVNYFAYGSNMCLQALQKRNGVTPKEPGVPAKLDGYRLLFNKESSDCSGKANIEACPGKEVWGVLYRISDEQLKILEDKEKGYMNKIISIQRSDGTTESAWTFTKESPGNNSLFPYLWYKRFLVDGAREHELPAEYIARLGAIEAVDDLDTARDRKEREIKCG